MLYTEVIKGQRQMKNKMSFSKIFFINIFYQIITINQSILAQN